MAGDGISVDGELVTALASLAGGALRGRHNLDNLCGAITASRLLTRLLPDFTSLADAVSSMPALAEPARDRGELRRNRVRRRHARQQSRRDDRRTRGVRRSPGGPHRRRSRSRTDLRGLARALADFGDVTLVLLGAGR